MSATVCQQRYYQIERYMIYDYYTDAVFLCITLNRFAPKKSKNIFNAYTNIFLFFNSNFISFIPTSIQYINRYDSKYLKGLRIAKKIYIYGSH